MNDETNYVIKPGDTLWSIAKTHLGNGARWPAIFKRNKHVIANPNLIFPGQVIVVPKVTP